MYFALYLKSTDDDKNTYYIVYLIVTCILGMCQILLNFPSENAFKILGKLVQLSIRFLLF